MHKVISTLRDLIAIPSVNPMGGPFTGEIYSEKNIVSYLKQRFSKIGMDVKVIHPLSDHPSIVAYYDAGASETILLDSHLDTVSHLEMSIAPFDPLIKSNLLYGRGSCDTKASMATYISVLEDCIHQGLRITKNIIILGCSDEEYSFSGISALDKVGLKADYALVGEPTDLKANRSHKGLLRCIISSQGIAGHSSAPERGENAIYRMAEAVLKLRDYHSGLSSVQHPLLGSASLSVGTIQGGTTVNTIPSSATIQVDRRLIPGEDPETVFNDLQKLLKPISGITLSAPYVTCAGFEEPEASTICKLLHQGCQHQQHSLEFIHTPFATHAPFFQALGIPTLVFGPGSITQAHTKDEFVPISEVEKFYAIIRHLVTS